MGSRRKTGASPPFRAWGVTLTLLAIVLAFQRLWGSMLFVLAALVFYLAVVRLTRCRVETKQHRPCLWRVRGLLGTCDYHLGHKRSLPVLVRSDRHTGVPMFMWPRYDAAVPTTRPEPQPGATKHAATAPKARRPGYDWAMMAIGIVGVAVSFGSLLNNLLA